MPNVILTFFCLALIPAAGFAQQNPADWKPVRELVPGSGIFVKTKAGEKYHGDLVEVTDDLLRLDSDERAFPGRTKKLREFRREEIREVRLLAPIASTLAGAALGGAVGAGIGAGLDAMPRVNDDPHLATGLLGVLGAALGSTVGHNVTLVKGRRIYLARKRVCQRQAIRERATRHSTTTRQSDRWQPLAHRFWPKIGASVILSASQGGCLWRKALAAPKSTFSCE